MRNVTGHPPRLVYNASLVSANVCNINYSDNLDGYTRVLTDLSLLLCFLRSSCCPRDVTWSVNHVHRASRGYEFTAVCLFVCLFVGWLLCAQAAFLRKSHVNFYEMSRMDSSLDNRNRQDFLADLNILFDRFSANGNRSGEQLQAGEPGSDAGCMADDVRQRQRKTFSEMSGAMIDHRRLFSLNLPSLSMMTR